MASPYVAGAVGAGRRRGRSRRRGDRHGRRHHHDRGVLAAAASCTPTASRSAASTSPWIIARGLNARIADAERIKTLYGSVLAGGSDERDMIAVPPVDDDEREAPQFVSRAQPRAHHQAAHRRNSRNGARPARGVAVRGGAARARGAHRRREPAHRPCRSSPTQILGRPVRIGRPLGIAGLPEEAKGPAFAVATGLLVYPQVGASRTFRTAANAALDDWNGRLYRTGRTMASRELLMTRQEIPMRPVADRRDRRRRKTCDAA